MVNSAHLETVGVSECDSWNPIDIFLFILQFLSDLTFYNEPHEWIKNMFYIQRDTRGTFKSLAWALQLQNHQAFISGLQPARLGTL